MLEGYVGWCIAFSTQTHTCKRSDAEMIRRPNKITGANAGGPPQLAMRTPWAARVGQFHRSADMRDSRLQRFLWPVGLIAVTGLIGALALLICPYAAPLTTPALRVLADREFNPPHSLRSQVLSLGFQPIGFVLDLPTVAHVASRDTRHWVYSIISRPNE